MLFSTLPKTPIILIVGLIVATCVIAYWSDNLGKKLGKKRVTLFNLRPRQTATLITMASSVGIMALTLIGLLWFSKSLRNSLTKYDATVRDYRQAQRENEKLAAQLPNLRQRVKAERESAASARAASAQTQRELSARRRDLSLASRNLSQATRNLQVAQRNTNAARLQASQAQSSAASARENQNRAVASERLAKTAAEEIRVRLVSVRDELQQNRVEFRQVDAQLQRQRAQLRRQQTAVQQARERARNLSTTNQKIREANGKLIRKEVELKLKVERQLEQSQNRIDALQARRVELEAGIREAVARLDELEKAAVYNTTVAGLLGAGRIAVPREQVLAETRLPASSEPSAIRVALRELLQSGAQEAGRLSAAAEAAETETSEGEPANTSSDSSAATLRFPTIADKASGVVLDEAAQIARYADGLSTFKIPISLRVVAARNYAPGEKAFDARLDVVPIRRAFVAGETLTSSTIDGNATDAQIFNSLLALVNAGERVARARGVVPLLSPQSPEFFATGTNERIFEILRETQMRARLVRVRLVADGDVSTVDNLKVRFVLEKVSA